jgi:hypothetical protein
MSFLCFHTFCSSYHHFIFVSNFCSVKDVATTTSFITPYTLPVTLTTLEKQVEEAVLCSLVPPDCYLQSFRHYCNQHTELFGTYGSKRRRSIMNRQYYLKQQRKKNYKDFKRYSSLLGI